MIPPGLENEALDELRDKSPALGIEGLPPVEKLYGGLELTLPWSQGRGLLHVLKIPTRVLVRLDSVTARDFPKLFQKTAKLPWTNYLSHPTPSFSVSCKECRLMHSGRVEETLRDALVESQKGRPFSLRFEKEKIEAETVYVRGEKDVWTFSLDIAGTALYKRGTSIIKGVAPIRENLAQASLRFLFKDHQGEEVTLWDPMCGSGTLILEAASSHEPVTRGFAYEKSILNLGLPAWKPAAALPRLPISKLIGSDLNGELVQKLTSGPGVHFEQKDFFESTRPTSSTLWIVSNPPYGERIKTRDDTTTWVKRLGERLGALKPQQVLLVIPSDWPKLKIPGLKKTRSLSFSNGGIAVEAVVFEEETALK